VIVVGGLCFYTYSYTYTLSQQINYLSEQLAVFQQEQAAQIDALSEELTTLKTETLIKLGVLEGEIGEATSRLDILEDEISDVTAAFSPSVINANEVYQKVKHAIVRISNGEQTVGSGFILDAQAHVVTAHHVTENLPNIYVILSDGSISPATITGSCQNSDVAVLTLEDELPVDPLALADSATVRIGEPVVTIGNPFELTETLTSGIVSQVNRFVEIEADSETRWVANLIQFDAAANFGNSGGPLLNSEGEVIGMVIARVNPDEGDGIYHAVSSNKIRRVTASLIDQGSFDYPWLGVEITNLTPK
jgi:S1-C subfamily serine protease